MTPQARNHDRHTRRSLRTRTADPKADVHWTALPLTNGLICVSGSAGSAYLCESAYLWGALMRGITDRQTVPSLGNALLPFQPHEHILTML
jgi:hypothetical protein